MRIGIDISQIVYEGTGVARYVQEMTRHLLAADVNNEYVLFGASVRQGHRLRSFVDSLRSLHPNVSFVLVPFPPRMMHILWNILHVAPIEWFIGLVDIFWSSDWTQPPSNHAKCLTTIHDLSVLTHPDEMDRSIVATHIRRLRWVQKECDMIICDSQATKDDCMSLLSIPENKLRVIYPGFRTHIL